MGDDKFKNFVKYVSILAVIIGLLAIFGWVFGVEQLKRVATPYSSMKFNAAVSFVFIGVSLYSLTVKNRTLAYFSSGLLLIVFIIPALTIMQDWLNINLHIDEWFVLDNGVLATGQAAGRMAPTTAFCFLILSASIFASKQENYSLRLACQYLLHVVTILSFIVILGYVFNVPALYKFTFIASMAMNTAILFLFLSVATSCLNPTIGIIALFTSSGIGNAMARRLFPLVTVMLLLIGYLRLVSHREEWVSVEFGIALFVTSFLILSLIIIENTARHLNALDSKRHEAEENLKIVNKQLEQKFLERTVELQESEQKFYKTFLMNPAGMMISEIETGKFREVNQSFADLLGYSKEELMGKNAAELGITSAEERQRLSEVLKTRGFLKNVETSLLTKDGEQRFALISAEVIDFGTQKRALTILYDITERKVIERKLEEAKKLAEESMLAKERFMSNMSHEIRTPLNAIIGFTNLIDQAELKQEQQQYLQYIKTSGNNLLVLVNDILDYAKIEAGMLKIEEIQFSIKDLLDSLRMMFSEQATNKGLDLNLEVSNNVPPITIGDPSRLTQIFTNLLSNGIKFTEKGSITISATVNEVLGDKVLIDFSIRDTGVGIPANKLHDIFQRFVQANNDTTRVYGGSGLGLSIVQSLVELLHGNIKVDSVENEGSEFRFSIPFLLENASVSKERNDIEEIDIIKFEPEKNVLLVEDNVLNQILAKKVLSNFGCQVDLAENGGVGIEMAKSKSYDLILMDIQMPIMDGYSAARSIRKELKLTVPIIAMTAHVMSGERERCLAAGMNDYISKPFGKGPLYAIIKKHTS